MTATATPPPRVNLLPTADPDLTARPPESGRAESQALERRSWFGPLLAITAGGVLVAAIADAGARTGQSWADALFWVALLAMLMPTAYRLVGSEAGRSERLGLVVLLGLGLYAVTVLHSPGGFDLHDELGQYRSVHDILQSGKLLSPNPIVADYAYYPGLIAITAALSKLTGLGIFASGLIVVALSRCLLVLALFALVERVTRSSRIAGIAVLLYAANPNFLFFDAQFAYETLGLALAGLALWMTSRAVDGGKRRVPETICVLLVVAATVLTHHLASYALCLLLIGWAVMHAFTRSRGRRRGGLWLPAVAELALVATAAWAWFAYGPTQKDIGGSITGSLHGLIAVLTGSVATKAPFTSPAMYADTQLAKAVGLLSVALLLAALPFALWAAWRSRRLHPLVLVFALVALTYPVTLAVRLTQSGTEASNRSSEYVFLALASLIALATVRWLGPRIDSATNAARLTRLLPVALVTLIFLGGVIVGWPPYARIPARYLVESDSRSVNALDVSAARWAGSWLPAHSRILTDIDNELLMAAYGNLDPQGGQIGGLPVASVFTSTTFGSQTLEIVESDHIRYLVVDSRLASAPPAIGKFFRDSGLTNSALPAQALGKFATTPDLDRIFDSGPISIYQLSGPLRSGQ